MTSNEAEKLCEYIKGHSALCLAPCSSSLLECYPTNQVRDVIMEFAQKESTEGETCADTCRPDYEKMIAELQKELDYWKTEHRHMHEKNIRLEGILRTIEVWTGKNFLG